MNKNLLLLVLNFTILTAFAQPERWQQKVKYVINTELDVKTNKFSGTQKITYWNNSPDTLKELFFHLYLNAFQPGSSMDVRSRELGKNSINGRQDWDSRVKDRIANLKPDEIGYQKITSLKVNGNNAQIIEHGTILQVKLSKPLLPLSRTQIDLSFDAQVPIQIRRTGRDNPNTQVRYSMSQWYPKLANYDYEGWHANPYIAREFYGIWGDFDVTITLDKTYKIGGTGVLQNPSAIGWGYDNAGTPLKNIPGNNRTWRFIAENVHDFVWAADPDFEHIVQKINNGPVIHVIYNKINEDPAWKKQWQNVADMAVKVLPFIEKNYGKYPYPQYSFIHGGDGGMEYAMATLIHSPNIGTAIHEWMHSWYQMILGSNESLYPWMDEGFTSFAEEEVSDFLAGSSMYTRAKDSLAKNPANPRWKNIVDNYPEKHGSAYNSYYSLVKSGLQEPLTTHADHYNTNTAYSIASYSMGEVFLEQLGYITGSGVRDKILLSFYDTWKFKHPNANDFIVVAQKVAGLQLQWYKQYWVNSTKRIDYGIETVNSNGDSTLINLIRKGDFPMPVDVYVTLKNGQKHIYNIPLNLMFGAKQKENQTATFTVEKEWDWVAPAYELKVNFPLDQIAGIEIDGSKRMADVDRSNNKWAAAN